MLLLAEGNPGKIPGAPREVTAPDKTASNSSLKPDLQIPVIFENEHILLVNKPAGLLTQKAEAQDYSLNEWLTDYLLSRGKSLRTSCGPSGLPYATGWTGIQAAWSSAAKPWQAARK